MSERPEPLLALDDKFRKVTDQFVLLAVVLANDTERSLSDIVDIAVEDACARLSEAGMIEIADE